MRCLLYISADDREGILFIMKADYSITLDVRLHFFKDLNITFLGKMHHTRLCIVPHQQAVRIGDFHLNRCLRLDLFVLINQFEIEEPRHVHVNIFHLGCFVVRFYLTL